MRYICSSSLRQRLQERITSAIFHLTCWCWACVGTPGRCACYGGRWMESIVACAPYVVVRESLKRQAVWGLRARNFLMMMVGGGGGGGGGGDDDEDDGDGCFGGVQFSRGWVDRYFPSGACSRRGSNLEEGGKDCPPVTCFLLVDDVISRPIPTRFDPGYFDFCRQFSVECFFVQERKRKNAMIS